MEIVLLTPDDWAVFRAVRLAALAEAPYAFGSTLEDEQHRDEAGWRANLATRAQFVARDGDGTVLGTAGAIREGGRDVQLRVAEDNPAAERLYVRYGFTRFGEMSPIRPGEPRMRAEMVLRL